MVGQKLKNLPAMQKTRVRSLGQEDPLEKGMATHSSILPWRISWLEEPGGLQSMGSQRDRPNWAHMLLMLLFYLKHVSSWPGMCGYTSYRIRGILWFYLLITKVSPASLGFLSVCTSAVSMFGKRLLTVVPWAVGGAVESVVLFYTFSLLYQCVCLCF